jgi:WD40 repeat protein
VAQLAQAQEPERGDIRDLAWSPDGAVLAVLADHGLWLYDTGDWESSPQAIQLDAVVVRNVAFSPDGRLLAVGAESDVQLWDVETRDRVLIIEDYGGRVLFSSDGEYLFIMRNRVEKFEVETGDRVSRFGDYYWAILLMAVSPDGRWLAVSNLGEGGHLWDMQTNTPAAELYMNTLIAKPTFISL